MDLSGLAITTLIACILFSCFFSASETTLTSLSEAKTLQLIEEKRYGASFLRLWLKKPNHVLTAILVGNNIVNVLAAAVATVIAERLFGSIGISIATALVTVLLLIFGEITPKTFARHNAVRLAPVLMTFLTPFYWLLYPVVISLTWLSGLLLKLTGTKDASHSPLATEEDIAFLIRLGHQEGVLQSDQGEMLESIIDFRDTIVREAMVPRTQICSLDKNASLEEVFSQIKENGHTRWPVYDDNIDNVVGIFHTKDLLGIHQQNTHFRLSEHLRPALFIPDSMKLGSLLKEFRVGKAHLAIVVDEYGGTAGIISLEDLLEEIVGEIRDEYDSEEEEQLICSLEDGGYLVDGRTNISELGEVLQIEFPESELFDSLGGFLTTTLGKVPEPETEMNFADWQFKVKEADAKRIVSVLIKKTS